MNWQYDSLNLQMLHDRGSLVRHNLSHSISHTYERGLYRNTFDNMDRLPPQHGQSQRVLTPSSGMSFLEPTFQYPNGKEKI